MVLLAGELFFTAGEAYRDAMSGLSRPRHKDWPKVRATHLFQNPNCRACGNQEGVEVHHELPVHAFPEHELDASTFVTLCGPGAGIGGTNCHLLIGHGGCYRDWNQFVRRDAVRLHSIIDGRKRG